MFLEHFRTEEICFRTLDVLVSESMIDLKDIHLINGRCSQAKSCLCFLQCSFAEIKIWIELKYQYPCVLKVQLIRLEYISSWHFSLMYPWYMGHKCSENKDRQALKALNSFFISCTVAVTVYVSSIIVCGLSHEIMVNMSWKRLQASLLHNDSRGCNT